jgi:co-chaperonin GroES (HSP10)
MEERVEKMGAIVMPGAFQQRTEKAEVMAVGAEVENYKVGDKILISYSAGTHIQLPETYKEQAQHRIIIEHNILCRYEEDEDGK